MWRPPVSTRTATRRPYTPRSRSGDAGAPPGVAAAALEQLEDEGRHRVDAGVAGAHQRDVAAIGGEVEGDLHALLLLAQLVAVARLAGGQRPQQVEVEGVADEVAGAQHGRFHFRGDRNSAV